MKKYISILRTGLITGATLVFFSPEAMCWGQKGHDTVCQIAENHLSYRAKKQITDLLGGQSIVYWANWLDNASHTKEYSYTSTWHYMNIDENETFENAQRHPKGDVVTAIEKQVEILKNNNSSRDEKTLALKILVHLTGDIHCPMHMGRKSDRGGNQVQVRFFGSGKNLHSVFDTEIVERAHKWSHEEWAEEVDRGSNGKPVCGKEFKEITAGTPADWARQTHSITTTIYETTPAGSKLYYDYVATWAPTIEQQLLRGGLRLAALLNSIF